MIVESITTDCDGDSLLVQVKPKGPACHLGFTSCFHPNARSKLAFLHSLIELIQSREKLRPEGSYISQLFESGINRCAQKVGEEAVETVIAATIKDSTQLINESADLLFHLLVLLETCQVSFYDLLGCLEERHKSAP